MVALPDVKERHWSTCPANQLQGSAGTIESQRLNTGRLCDCEL